MWKGQILDSRKKDLNIRLWLISSWTLANNRPQACSYCWCSLFSDFIAIPLPCKNLLNVPFDNVKVCGMISDPFHPNLTDYTTPQIMYAHKFLPIKLWLKHQFLSASMLSPEFQELKWDNLRSQSNGSSALSTLGWFDWINYSSKETHRVSVQH